MDQLLKKALEEQNAFRPAPFWSWNGVLEEEILRGQVRDMAKQGLGGFFMHARVGINTPYMGEDWYRCVSVCIDEAKKCGIDAWGYDEDGYPSGIASGKVCDADENYRSTWIELVPADSEFAQKYPVLAQYRKQGTAYIRCETDADTVLIRKNETRAADPMNKEAVELFIKLTHEEYYKRYQADFGKGKAMPGFFTDEPQLKQFQLPWSDGFEKAFAEAYGYDLLDRVFCLKYDLPGKEKVRNDYWSLINRLYCDVFGKLTGDWCRAHGGESTGHVMGEDTLLEQMGSNGGVMPFYEYMDVPGMDWLERRIGGPLTPKQVSSVAAQLGKRRVLAETFALSGWDVSFQELKWMAEWQLANGINLLCPHLQSYSLRGIRKRDYPPSLFIQQNWWEEYHIFNDYISRLGSLLANTEEICDLLVLHPLHSAHVLYNGSADCAAVRQLDEELSALNTALQGNHIAFHYGDEIILQKYGSVREGALVVGNCRYHTLLLPKLTNILSSTRELIAQFVEAGGRVCYLDALPPFTDGEPDDSLQSLPLERITLPQIKSLDTAPVRISLTEGGKPCRSVLCTKRRAADTTVLFLVNTDLTEAHALTLHTTDIDAWYVLDMQDFTTRPADSSFTLLGGESVVLISRPQECKNLPCRETVSIALPEELTIEAVTPNTYTLDRCDFSVEGGPWEENVPIILMQRRLLDRQKNCPVKMRFAFELETTRLPAPFYLVSENIPAFSVTVNGMPLAYREEGSFLDPDFKKLDITAALQPGRNTIELAGAFWQRQALYDRLYKDKDLSSNFYACDFDFEAVTYDTELESIYLLGDFCVESRSPYTYGERRAVMTDGPFVLTNPKRQVKTGDITVQGFPFFTGTMRLGFDVTLSPKEGTQYLLDCKKPHCPVAAVYVGGERLQTLAWEPAQADLTPLLREGCNHIAVELFSSHRNLLGPHHYIDGECYSVGVSTFADVPGWCEHKTGNIWADRYCFVRYGFDTEKEAASCSKE